MKPEPQRRLVHRRLRRVKHDPAERTHLGAQHLEGTTDGDTTGIELGRQVALARQHVAGPRRDHHGAGQAADLGGKVLKVGSDTTYPPMETVDPATGQIVGFDVDILNAICAKINCKAEFVTTAWDGIFAALQQGQFDLVASGVSITDERKQTMDFSDPYLVVSQAVMLRVADEGMTLDDIKSKGLKLAAQTATTNAQLAEELVGRDNVALYDTFAGAILSSGFIVNMSPPWMKQPLRPSGSERRPISTSRMTPSGVFSRRRSGYRVKRPPMSW